MAATLRIPNPYRKGLQALLVLTAEQADGLLSALSKVSPFTDTEDIVADVEKSVPQVDPELSRQIIEALMALYSVRISTSMSVPDLGRAVATSGDLEIAPEAVDSSVDRLTSFLGLRSLFVSSKALDVASDNERSFEAARIETDLRPIYGESVLDAPAAAVVIHHLKISFSRNESTEDFWVAMTPDDLVLLKSVLDRAQEKQRSLLRAFSNTGIPYLTVESE